MCLFSQECPSGGVPSETKKRHTKDPWSNGNGTACGPLLLLLLLLAVQDWVLVKHESLHAALQLGILHGRLWRPVLQCQDIAAAGIGPEAHHHLGGGGDGRRPVALVKQAGGAPVPRAPAGPRGSRGEADAAAPGQIPP